MANRKRTSRTATRTEKYELPQRPDRQTPREFLDWLEEHADVLLEEAPNPNPQLAPGPCALLRTFARWPKDTGYPVLGLYMPDEGRTKAVRACRLVLLGCTGDGLATEPPFPDAVARHLCGGDKACVNPEHLAWGTDRDNHSDYKLHCALAGVPHSHSLVSDADAREIQTLWESGEWPTRKALALDLGLNPKSFHKVLRRKCWDLSEGFRELA